MTYVTQEPAAAYETKKSVCTTASTHPTLKVSSSQHEALRGLGVLPPAGRLGETQGAELATGDIFYILSEKNQSKAVKMNIKPRQKREFL